MAIEVVLNTDTANFFELAEMIGLDPRQDFAGANLRGVDLSDSDLSYANFARADLRGANLSNADLTGANLYQANIGITTLTCVINILNRAHELAQILNKSPSQPYTQEVVKALDKALYLVRERPTSINDERTVAYAFVFHLNLALNYARIVFEECSGKNDFTQKVNEVFTLIDDLVQIICGGANLKNANLKGVILDA